MNVYITSAESITVAIHKKNQKMYLALLGNRSVKKIPLAKSIQNLNSMD